MKQPKITGDFHPTLSTISKTSINGIQLYYLNDENCELVKIEWVFEAGTVFQTQSLQASFAADLLLEGTNENNSNDFARKLDELGAYFNSECGKDFTSFTLYVLEQHLQKALAIIYPMFTNPLFSDEDFNDHLIEAKQDFEKNQRVSAYIARTHLRKNIYHNHPYGKLATIESYKNINKSVCFEYAQSYFLEKKHQIFISGNATDHVLKVIEAEINKISWKSSTPKNIENCVLAPIKGTIEVHHKTAQQESVRMGINIPNANEKDYLNINLANSILGGYFGSRLMQNIREEKGWTYGINSSILPGKLATSLFISTDVLTNKGKACITEIHKEINTLKKELISKEELQKVTAYIKGTLLQGFDGVFEQMDRFQSCLLNGLEQTHHLDYLELIKTIQPEVIQSTFQTYFNEEDFTQVIVKK